jgi:hypothetical protein
MKIKVFYIPFVIILFTCLADIIIGLVHPPLKREFLDNMPWIPHVVNTGNYKRDLEIGLVPNNTMPGLSNPNELRSTVYYSDESHLEGKKNILFIGDSVTEEGHVIRALYRCFNKDSYNLWNSGVGSFNINQVVAYYDKYLKNIPVDRVIYIFHLSDWFPTPILYKNSRGELTGFTPVYGEALVNEYLYKKSHLYHLFLSLKFGTEFDLHKARPRMIEQLNLLRKLVGDKEFSIIITPIIEPLDLWTDDEVARRLFAIDIFKELNIPFIDMSKYIPLAISQGVELDGYDKWHPGIKIAEFFSEQICQEKSFLNAK